MKLYALHDRKAKAFTDFHVLKSDTVASRGFAEAVMQPNSLYSKYADDFELVSLCDVSQEYEDLAVESLIGSFDFQVIITAAQILAAQPSPSRQIPLALEA